MRAVGPRRGWATSTYAVVTGSIVGVALVLATFVLAVLNRPAAVPLPVIALRGSVPVAVAVTGLIDCALGALVAARRPRNVLGWLMFGIGLATVVEAFAFEYAVFGLLTAPRTVPAALLAVQASAIMFVPVGLLLAILPPLLFPDGRLPSPAWRLPLLVALASVAITGGAAAIMPGPFVLMPFAENPFGAPVAAALVITAITIGSAFGGVALAFGVAAVMVRYRRGATEERQQLKWYIYATALAAAADQIMFVQPTALLSEPSLIVISLAAALPPVAMTVAILRYRLYAIDILIRRTIVYGATTVGLGAVFFGSVVIAQALLRPFTGGSELAVATSTLATVALFQPLRWRIQSAVDRRFYRARYDASRTLDAFSARLGDEVDLDALRTALLGVVGETMTPAHAGLWLRERV